MAGVNVLTDANVQEHPPEPTATTAARLRQYCRAQPELAGLVIGAALSAPLLLVLLKT